jgi:hypothetical protein
VEKILFAASEVKLAASLRAASAAWLDRVAAAS